MSATSRHVDALSDALLSFDLFFPGCCRPACTVDCVYPGFGAHPTASIEENGKPTPVLPSLSLSLPTCPVCGLQSARSLMACGFCLRVGGRADEAGAADGREGSAGGAGESSQGNNPLTHQSSSSDMFVTHVVIHASHGLLWSKQDMEVLRRAVEEVRADNRKLEVSTTTYAHLRLFRHFPLYLVLCRSANLSYLGRDGSLLPSGVNCGFGCG
ncbi:hypothetical protein B296_00003441 [Ensete ventricosum]|uniref:Uncharacterized protein n=1 Tax=Ensete ventricosum TaxID=4639 RepID=A0A427AZ97_ENSVE|nr:hypothetical protein B296_00003441 [Ensete ventricosum]